MGSKEKTDTALPRRTSLKGTYLAFYSSLLPSMVTRSVTNKEISKALSRATRESDLGRHSLAKLRIMGDCRLDPK